LPLNAAHEETKAAIMKQLVFEPNVRRKIAENQIAAVIDLSFLSEW